MPGNVTERLQQPPQIDVPVVIFSLLCPAKAGKSTTQAEGTAQHLYIRLVKRTREPFKNQWALPGAPLVWNESLSDTAARVCRSVLGLEPQFYEQLFTFGDVGRSATDLRRISVAHWALLSEDDARRVQDVDNVEWRAVEDATGLAFDHERIVQYARRSLKESARALPIGRYLLGSTFTLAQLRRVHEIILGTRLDVANFRRRMLANGNLVPAGKTSGGAHRPAQLYRYEADSEISDSQ